MRCVNGCADVCAKSAVPGSESGLRKDMGGSVVEEMVDGDERQRQLKCEAACAIQCLQVCASG
jgi:hypothetical protein